MVMRLELSQAGDAFLGGNYQLYNVLVTGHAFLMIFLCADVVIQSVYYLNYTWTAIMSCKSFDLPLSESNKRDNSMSETPV
jgi:heme/copper-type cytochrome/quinol oxidase subunit 1